MDIYTAVTDRIIAQMEQGIFEEDFIDVTSRVFSEMRLMTEGAIIVYEEDTQPLCRLARDDDDNSTILNALNDIGTALYALRTNIRQLQEAHHKELLRQISARRPL